MSDSGVPTRDVAAPHVATPQWQSFEGRMRARKAERCLQRAAAALADGSIVEASAALDEARQLSPDDSRVQELSGRLELLKQPALPTPRRYAPAGAMAAACVILAAAGWQTWMHREQLALMLAKPQPQTDMSAGLAAPSSASNGIDQRTDGSGVPTSTTGTSSGLIVQTTLIRPDSVIDTRLQSDESEVGDQTIGPIADGGIRSELKPDVQNALATRSPDTPTSAQLDTPSPAVSDYRASAVPATPAPTSYIPSVVLPSEPLRAPISSAASTNPSVEQPPVAPASNFAPAASSLNATTSATPTVVRDDRVAIRSALNRYEAGFNRLDVEAVRSIWPTLDQRALARAFDSLNSQRVSLQACNVDVTGNTARANCSGNATWAPKVGGGMQSASRKWTFDLSESADGGWRIVHVQAR